MSERITKKMISNIILETLKRNGGLSDMGFTRYYNLKCVDKARFDKATDMVRDVFAYASSHCDDVGGISLCGPLGEGKPIIGGGDIAFNGDVSKGEKCESFYIGNYGMDNGGGGYAKTDYKPYDIFVCLACIVFKFCYGENFEWRSDVAVDRMDLNLSVAEHIFINFISRKGTVLGSVKPRKEDNGNGKRYSWNCRVMNDYGAVVEWLVLHKDEFPRKGDNIVIADGSKSLTKNDGGSYKRYVVERVDDFFFTNGIDGGVERDCERIFVTMKRGVGGTVYLDRYDSVDGLVEFPTYL